MTNLIIIYIIIFNKANYINQINIYLFITNTIKLVKLKSDNTLYKSQNNNFFLSSCLIYFI